MRDIPMFTTENGVASVFLSQIPYTGIGRVKLQATESPMELLEECRQFCVACGAGEVYASGHACLDAFPVSATVLEMQADAFGMDQTDAALFPVISETMGQWRKIVNERMASVPNASYIPERDEKELLEQGNCYFIHRNGTLLGVGKAEDDRIDVVASVVPGAGKDVVMVLSRLIGGDVVKVTVAKENMRAVKLYESLGFVTVSELSRWYKIL